MGKTTKQILQCHLQKLPLAPSRLQPGVPPGVDRLLLRWLSKDRSERPASAREGLREIEAVAGSLQAPAPTVRTVPLRVWRKHWLLLPLSGLILVLACALLWVPRPPDTGSDPGGLRTAVPPTVALPVASTGQAAPADPASAPRSEIAVIPSVPPNRPSTEDDAVVAPEQLADARTRPLAPHLKQCVGLLSSLASTRLRALWADAAGPLRRFEPLQELGRSFEATFVALVPERDPPAHIFLRYEFVKSSELADFRTRSGAFAVGDGVLRRVGEPANDVLDTSAWFVPPLRVGGHFLAEGVLAVGLGPLRVAPGSGHNAEVWLAGEGSSRLPSPVPVGSWSVEFFSDEVKVMVEGEIFRLAAPPLARHAGRVTLEVGPGVSIGPLEIEGRLQPDWAAERLRLVSKGR